MDETFLGEDALHRRNCFFFRCSSIIYVVAASPPPKKKRRHQNRIRMVFFTCLLFSTLGHGVPGFFVKGETKKVAFPAVPGDHPVPSSSWQKPRRPSRVSCVVYIPGVAPAWPSRAGVSRTSFVQNPAKEYIKISKYTCLGRGFLVNSQLLQSGDEITTNEIIKSVW